MHDKAKGICDRCGLTFKLRQLRKETVGGVLSSNLVCPDCWDKDHPQLLLGRVPMLFTGEGVLTNPRPDTNPGRGFFGWNPVGDPLLCATGSVGSVTVTTD